MELEPRWGILYFTYDWFSAIRTDLVREVKYDTFITVYMSDCDFYPRVRAAGWKTLELKDLCPGISPRVSTTLDTQHPNLTQIPGIKPERCELPCPFSVAPGAVCNCSADAKPQLIHPHKEGQLEDTSVIRTLLRRQPEAQVFWTPLGASPNLALPSKFLGHNSVCETVCNEDACLACYRQALQEHAWACSWLRCLALQLAGA